MKLNPSPLLEKEDNEPLQGSQDLKEKAEEKEHTHSQQAPNQQAPHPQHTPQQHQHHQQQQQQYQLHSAYNPMQNNHHTGTLQYSYSPMLTPNYMYYQQSQHYPYPNTHPHNQRPNQSSMQNNYNNFY
jgi:hypothetical protein